MANFRHLISVCHNHQNSSPSIPSSSSTPSSCPALPETSNNQLLSKRSYSSNSTPTTPNMSRLRTLTSSGDLIINKRIHDVHFPNDECRSMTPPDKPPRSMSQTKTPGRKSRSSFIKKKSSKNDESKWYIETTNINTNNNNNNNHDTSTISTPNIDRSSRKLGSSSSSSLCSTPNDRSIFRALFDVNTILTSIGLGRRIDSPQHQPVLVQPKRSTQLNESFRSRYSCSPIRPNSLVFSSSSQNSSQITDDDNEKYYSAQSSKISTPMVQTLDYRKNSHDTQRDFHR